MAGASRFPHEIKEKSEQLSQAAGDAKEQAKETAGNLTQKAQDTLSGVTERAKDLVSTARERADTAVSGMGGRVSDLADTIRERAPQEGVAGRAAGMLADQLEAGGHYLQEHGVQDMVEDIATVIRNRPLTSLVVLLGVGFMLGKAMSRR
ncbi:MAG TPA: hypothetical protein VFA18_15995 [Gemmataceae bacterium]|nr:hypothetical protein [Gemmataceae bacterium]